MLKSDKVTNENLIINENQVQDKVERYEPFTPNEANKEDELFRSMRQGIATNELSKIVVKPNDANIDPITGTAVAKRNNLQLSIFDFVEFKLPGFRTTTSQLLDILIIKFTETGSKDKIIKLPLKEYMEIRGLKDAKQARKQINADLEVLYRSSISFTEKRRNKDFQPYYDVRILQAKGEIKRGTVEAHLSDVFFNIIAEYPFMSIPEFLFKIDLRYNPNSYNLGRKIFEHKRMNINKPNENIISVKTLLNSCPLLPTREEVAKKGRQIDQRIIAPFDRDLSVLNEYFTWHFCNEKKVRLTDEQLAAVDYETFESLYVQITWKKYPNLNKLIELKEKYKSKK